MDTTTASNELRAIARRISDSDGKLSPVGVADIAGQLFSIADQLYCIANDTEPDSFMQGLENMPANQNDSGLHDANFTLQPKPEHLYTKQDVITLAREIYLTSWQRGEDLDVKDCMFYAQEFYDNATRHYE